jgi:hypothetical protein
MNFDFLTPEIFDMLVIANLLVALFLIAFRFYQDMTHIDNEARQHREQAHDESSYDDLGDTNPSIAVQQMTENQQQTSQNQ